MTNGDFYIQLGILAFLLFLSAFFSGSETALFSLNSLEKDALRRRSTGKNAEFTARFFSHPDDILVTILTGNMFVNIFSSAIAEAIGARIFKEAAELLSIAAMTVLLLIIGEMTPKNLAIRHALKFSTKSTFPLKVIHTLLRPITLPLSRIRRSVLSYFPKQHGHAGTDQAGAILSAIRIGYDRQTIEESELQLLERFFRFRRKTAADIMIPRVNLHPVDGNLTIDELIRLIASGSLESEKSLIPIYRGNVDHITGYIRKIDLAAQRFVRDSRRLSAIARPIHAVPESKGLRELLNEMGKIGTEMAVVIDQYGGTGGLVSFPGLVSYLFEDFLPQHERSIEKTGVNSFRIAGHADISEVAAAMEIELTSTQRTIAGMLISEFGGFPEIGQEVVISGYSFRISGLDDHKISWIDVREIKS